MADQAPSRLFKWVIQPISDLLPSWLKAMFFGVPFAKKLWCIDTPQKSYTRPSHSVLSLDLLSDPEFSGQVKQKGIVDIVVPQSLFLRRQVTAPKTASGSLSAIAELDMQRKTPFSQGNAYWVLGRPQRTQAGITVDQWIAKRTAVIAWKERMANAGLHVRRLLIEDAGVLADFSKEVAPKSKIWRRVNGALACTLLGLGAFNWLYPAWSIEGDLKRLEHDKTTLTEHALSLRTATERLQQQEDEKTEFLSLLANRPLLSETLKELTEALSDDVWLTSIEFRNDTIVINGETTSSVPKLVLALSSHSRFDDVSLSGPVARTAIGAERFELNLRVEAAK